MTVTGNSNKMSASSSSTSDHVDVSVDHHGGGPRHAETVEIDDNCMESAGPPDTASNTGGTTTCSSLTLLTRPVSCQSSSDHHRQLTSSVCDIGMAVSLASLANEATTSTTKVPAGPADIADDDTARGCRASSPATCRSASQGKRVETAADWLILICVILFNMLNGLNFASYSVLYVHLVELFNTTRAAVGWIQSIEFSLGCCLGW